MPDEQRRDLIADEWLRYAASDEANAASILEHRDGNPAGVCFLAQQMAEKFLKALVIARTGSYERIHNLRTITEHVANAGVSVTPEVRSAAVELNPYYVATRYVADVPIESYTWSDAEEAFAAAQAIKRFVLERLGRTERTESGGVA